MLPNISRMIFEYFLEIIDLRKERMVTCTKIIQDKQSFEHNFLTRKIVDIDRN